MKDIKITIEDEDQKAFIMLKDGEDDNIDVSAEFEPALKNDNSPMPPVAAITLKFLSYMRQ